MPALLLSRCSEPAVHSQVMVSGVPSPSVKVAVTETPKWGYFGVRVMVPVSSMSVTVTVTVFMEVLDGVFGIVIDARAGGVVGGDYYHHVLLVGTPRIGFS